jgi:N12 class adenine-specific DNA methylase/predicted RNA methylase
MANILDQIGLDEAIAAYDEAEKKKPPSIVDLARAALAGYVGDTARGIGYLGETTGLYPEHGRSMREAGDWFVDEQQQAMTPGGRRAFTTPVVEGEGVLDLALSDKWGQSALMGVARSLPQMAMAAPIGFPVAGALTAGTRAVAPSLYAEGAKGIAPWLAKFLPAGIGYGGAEGLQAGAVNAADTKTEITRELAKKRPDLPADEIERIAAQAASEVFGRTALTTGAIGALTGGGALGALDRLERGARDGLVKSVFKGTAMEALQETPQSGGEAYIQNLAKRDYLDQTLDPLKGVAAQALEGGIVGGLSGGMVGGAGRIATPRTGEDEGGSLVQRIRSILGDSLAPTPAPAIEPEPPTRDYGNVSTTRGVATSDTSAQQQALTVPERAPSGKPGLQQTVLERVEDLQAELSTVLADVPEEGAAKDSDAGKRIAGLKSEIETLSSTFPELKRGAETQFGTEAGSKLKGTWALAELDSLTPSHDAMSMRENPRFPQTLQPRDRSAAGYELQVQGMAQRLDPARLAESPEVATGAPIVGADGIVESGNGRVMAIARAYNAEGPQAESYRTFLKEQAPKFGLDPQDVEKMKAPVLVRLRDTKVNRAEFARQANAPTTAQLSPIDQAKSDASRMGKLVQGLEVTEDGDVFVPANQGVIKQFFSMLPLNEQTALVDAKGRITEPGQRRFLNALAVKAYGEDSAAVMRMVGSMNDDQRNLSKALVRAAPRVARAREELAGTDLATYDITGMLVAAVEELTKAREQGITIADLKAQRGMFGDAPAEFWMLIEFLDANLRAPRRIAQFVEKYLDELGKYDGGGTADMFGGKSAPERAALVKGAIDEGTTEAVAGEAPAAPATAAPAAATVQVPGAPAPAGAPTGQPERGRGGAEVTRPGAVEPTQEKADDQPKPAAVPDQAPAQQQPAQEPATEEAAPVESEPRAAGQAPGTTGTGTVEAKPPEPAASASSFGQSNTVFTADAAARARELLRKKLGQVSAGLDPEIIQAGIQLAGYYIEGGARKFADYTAKMIGDLGEAVRPYLKSWYLAVRNYPDFDNAGMESEAQLEEHETAAKGQEKRAPEATTSETRDAPAPAAAEDDDGAGSVLDYVNESIGRAHRDATLLDNDQVKLFQSMLVDDGWQQRKAGKSVDWVKDGWYLFLRGQGKDAGTIVQWQRDEREDATPPTPDAPVTGKDGREWWEGELTQRGRAEKLKEAGIKRGPSIRWHYLAPNEQDALLALRNQPTDGGVLESFPGEANTEIRIVKNRDGAAVTMFDLDAQLTMPTLRMFKGDDAIEKAREYAKSVAKKAAPGAAAAPAATDTVDGAAHEAATSPQNDKPEPTDKMKRAGNYEKGHYRIAGLDISIENPQGSKRRPEWPALKSHYGYIRGTIGRDKDHVDVFVKPGTTEDWDGMVYVIDQEKSDGSFDEHKVMLGWDSMEAANDAYLENFTKGWDRIDATTAMALQDFKAWVFDKTEKGPRGGALNVAPPTDGVATPEGWRTLSGKDTPDEPTEQRPSETGDGESDRGARPGSGADSRPLAGGLAAGDARAGKRGQAAGGDQGSSGPRSGDLFGSESGGQEQPPGAPRADGDVRARPGATSAVTKPADYSITDADKLGEGTPKQKYRDNIAAIRALRTIEEEKRAATPEEQRALVRYVGWGGLKGAFDDTDKGWKKEFAELKELLSEDEYAAARRTILDAHYTSVPVVRGIYAIAKRLGFTQGRILEPSAGSGNFIGLLSPEMRRTSAITAVELDSITGRIARALYPKANVIAGRGFQDVEIPAGYFDLAVGNPPFGSQEIFDPARPELRFSIHNFFFAKSIESLRPGGILSMVVSRYFLDTIEPKARTWIAERAKLVGAIRLPETAFKQNAGTEVVTDIVVFQKLKEGERPDLDAEWLKTKDIRLPRRDDATQSESVPINGYFEAHPEMVLGQHALGRGLYRDNELIVTPKAGESIEAGLARLLPKFPEGIYEHPKKRIEVLLDVDGIVPEDVKVGSYFVPPSGGIARRLADTMGKRQLAKIEISDKVAERIRAMIEVRDALRKLMRAERTGEGNLGYLRQALNSRYDSFVKKYGYFNATYNRSTFAEEIDLPLLESLEPDYDPGISPATSKKHGIPMRAPKAGKADIFTKRVQEPYVPVTKADTPVDALNVSLSERGAVDLGFMAGLTGADEQTIVKELKGLIYRDPETGWVTNDEYLSGNVKAKLARARAAAEMDVAYRENVEALEAVQPKDVEPLEINVRLGSPWVPASDIAAFAAQTLKVSAPKITYLQAVAQWSVHFADTNRTTFESTYGTGRKDAGQILELLLNLKPIEVKDNVGTSREPKYVLNEEETRAAQAKGDEMARAFKDWIWADEARRDRLARVYNDRYNTDVLRKRDGAYLVLPGMNPEIELRKHQKDGIARIIQDRRALLDQVVGAGKTYEIIAAIMEMRRIGLMRKPIIPVPNHLVRQWRDEFYKLYPNASILAATEKDFEKANRQRLFGRIATGDWDAVIVGHSSFKKIGMPIEAQNQIIGEMLQDLEEAIEQAKREKGQDGKRLLREMEKIKENLKARMARLSDTGAKDKVATIDELGIDGIFVDEAHAFKNLFYVSQMRNVAGLGNPEGSERAFDLFVKLRWLQGQKGVTVFATGTPVSNSLVEMFTMQRYLMYDELKARGIHLLDGWANVFGDVQQVYEVHPSGNGYRLATRFAQFVNLPELMQAYKGFADVITLPDLKQQARDRGDRFPVPKVKGGKPQLRVSKRSDLQTQFFGVPEFVRNQDGKLVFDLGENAADYSVVQAPDGGKWAIHLTQDDRSQPVRTGFESEEEARAALETGLRTPRTQYNKGSILWKFENLKTLLRESEGKINALSITNEARKAALDYRLIDANAPDFEGSKVNDAAENVARIYRDWHEDRGTQLVFCDLSVPASAKSKMRAKVKDQAARDGAEAPEEREGAGDEVSETLEQESDAIGIDQLLALQSDFSVYDALKAKLIEKGVPAAEIAFIHDYDTAAKKQKLFGDVRSGRIRVLMGSTEKLGAGTNVQDRLVALHHLDAPWRPSDLEQREGRIIRQGNKLYQRDPDGFEVEILRYATEKTYDTRMWQLIEHKANGVEQLRKAGADARTIDDVGGEAANAADMKAAASGNPLILEEIKLRNEVKSLEAQKASWQRSLFDMQARRRRLSESPARLKARMAELDEWVAVREKNPADGATVTIDGETLKRDAVGGPINRKLAEAAKSKAPRPEVAGRYRGLEFAFQAGSFQLDAYIRLPGHEFWRGLASYGEKDKFSPLGFLTRIDNVLANIEGDRETARKAAEREAQQLTEVEAELAKPFAREDDLQTKRRRHGEVSRKLSAAGGAAEMSPQMRAEYEQALADRGVKPAAAEPRELENVEPFDESASRFIAGLDPYDVPTVRVSKRLRALLAEKEKGGLDDGQFTAAIGQLVGDMDRAREAREGREVDRDRVRGAEWLRERLIRARRVGELTKEQTDFALWLLERAPWVANDLAISVRDKASDRGSAATYNAFERLATIATSSDKPESVTHEILHHTERMMPPDVQRGIAKEYEKQILKAWNKATPTERSVLSDMVRAQAGDEKAIRRVGLAIKHRRVDYSFYQYTNVSEYWAVNATRIMGDRYEASKAGWVRQARQWLRELFEKMKGLLGLRSDAPVLKALEDVLSGKGEFQSETMLHALAQARFENVEPGSDLRRLLDRYEEGDDAIATVADVVDQVESLIDQELAPIELQDAVDKYRDEQRDDERLGGRGDMDAANDAFLAAVRAQLGGMKASRATDITRRAKVGAVQRRIVEAFGPEAQALFDSGLVTVVDRREDLPTKAQRDYASADDEAIHDAEARGGEGAVYIIASQIAPERVVPVLLHELGEHQGLPKLLGARYRGLLEDVRQAHAVGKNEALEAAWAFVAANYPGLKDGGDGFVSEVIAKVGETAAGRRLPFYRRILAAVREWLRSIGIRVEVSDEDLAALVAAAARAEIKGLSRPSGVPQMGDNRDTPALAASRRPENEAQGELPLPIDLHTTSGQRRLQAKLRDGIGDFLQTAKTFNWWHRSIGTQYHKAQVDTEHFKPVFDKGQEYLTDVTLFAMESEKLMQGIHPRVEAIGDVVKKAPKQEVLARVARALFEGTLAAKNPEDGRVWTRGELRRRFALSDEEITLYGQARAAVDRSLEQVAKATIGRIARTHEITVDRDMALEDIVASVHEQLEQKRTDINLRMAAAGELGKPTQGEANSRESIEQAMKSVNEIGRRARALQKGGYMPLMRFGRYAVDVTKVDESGKKRRVYFSLYETEAEANRVARALKAEHGDGTIVEVSIMDRESYKLFRGVSPDALEAFADIAGIDQHPLIQQWLQLAVSNRSALKRMIERKAVPGYSEDLVRVLSQFITSNARFAAGNWHHADMMDLVQAIPDAKGDVREEAYRLYAYLVDPREEAAGLRGYLFFHFMGGSIAAALVNMTQPLMMTAPYLTQFADAATVTKELQRAMRQAARTEMPDDAAGRAAAKALEAGLIAPHEIYQLMASARGGVGRSRFLHGLTRVWGGFFSLAEAWNRKSTFLAAYRIAETTGAADPYAFARKAVEETQGLYNRGNRPNWARGVIGAPIFTFKQFSIAYLEWFKRLPKPQKMAALAMLFFAAGLQGLPGADDLDDLLDTLGQWLGYDANMKRAKREALEAVVGEWGANFVMHGISAVPGMPIDVQARLGLGNLIPGSAMLKPSEQNKGLDALEFLGPTGGLVRSGSQALESAAKGDAAGAATALLPKAIADLAKAAQMFATGQYKDSRGRLVTDADEMDALVKAIGFQPSHIAAKTRRVSEVLESVNLHKVVEAGIADRWARAIVEDDDDALESARRDLADWNENNEDAPIRIEANQIRQRVRALRATREERILKTTPREMRGAMREALTQ